MILQPTQAAPELLAIIELGGYPDFTSMYKKCGYRVVVMNSMRKALHYLKKNTPSVIVAEFNYQSSFRDRLSTLESLIAIVQRRPLIKLIVFYEENSRHQFDRLRTQYEFFDAFSYPIDVEKFEVSLIRAVRQFTHQCQE